MKFGLKSKILIYILLPLLTFLFILYLLLFQPIKTYTEDTTKLISTKNIDYYNLLVNDIINSDIKTLKLIKTSLENFTGSASNEKAFQKSIFKYQISNQKEISSIWLLNEVNGETYFINFHQKENEIKFLSSKLKNGSFYKEIYKNEKNNFSEVNIYTKKTNRARTGNNLSFSVVTPVYFPNHTFGVVGFEFTIKSLSKKIENEDRFSKTNLMLLHNNDLFTLGYPLSEKEIEKAELKELILVNKKNKKTSFIYSNKQHTPYSVSIRPIDAKTTTGDLFLIVIEDANINRSVFSKLNSRFFIFLILFTLSVFFASLYFFINYKKQIRKTISVLNAMAFGDIPKIKTLSDTSSKDLSKVNKLINLINLNLDKTASFIDAIAKRNFSYNYETLNENDKIGNSLIRLKKNLEESQKIELNRKEKDKRLTWATVGTAKFSEIIREHSDNLEDLSYAIISDLVNYIGANQGGVFVINEDTNNEKYIELLASYAFSRRKMLTKKIPWGVGLVGRCILEKETIFMTKIPEKYLSISSGLGEETPASLLIVPLIFHEEVFGVVELASFSEIEQYKIDLVEHISESIASAISMVKINVRTAELLKETKIKSEQTASQEEEIRQNIEEMQAARDELNDKLEDANSVFKAVNSVANIAQFDMTGRIIDASENFLKLLQKERKDIIGKVQGSFSEEAKDPISFENFWNKLKKGQQMEFEQVIKVNNEIIRLNSIYIPIKNANGEVYKVVSFANKK